MTINSIVARWIAEARRHEVAADEIARDRVDLTVMDEEQVIHLEVARVLRNCARELAEIKIEEIA